MLHVMLRCPEVYTDSRFVSICTITLELRVENNINLYEETSGYGLYVTFILDQFRSYK